MSDEHFFAHRQSQINLEYLLRQCKKNVPGTNLMIMVNNNYDFLPGGHNIKISNRRGLNPFKTRIWNVSDGQTNVE